MDDTASERPTFEERFAGLAALSYKVAYRLVGDRSEAEDLAQEALARAYASWRKVSAYDEAWVARVTANLAIGRWRKHRRIVGDAAHRDDRHRDGAEDGSAAGPAGPAGWVRPVPPPDPVDHVELVAALRSLPRRQREVVTLRYLADLTEAEVAGLLGCSPGTVKQHAHRGLAALRRTLAHLGRPVGVPDADAQEEADVRASR